jgi:phage baseplate assembly protein gpV
MKNILSIIILCFVFIQIQAQSFEVNPRFISVPKYANQTAISAIASPVEGALVYDIAQDKYAYYTGTAWVNFPAAAGGGGSSTAAIQVPSYADATAINAIASPVEGMLVYNTATDTYFMHSAATWNEINPASGLWTVNSGTAIGYVGSVAIGGGGGTGKLNVSNTNVSFSNPDITFQTNTAVSPSITIRGNGSSAAFMRQVVTLGTTAASSVQWSRSPVSGTEVFTPAFTVNGNGNARAEGFTRMGPSSVAAPTIKYKLFTGTTNSGSSSTGQSPIAFSHGVDAAKIVDVNGLILNSGGEYVTPSTSGSLFRIVYDANNLAVVVSHTSTNCQNRPFKVLITYIE